MGLRHLVLRLRTGAVVRVRDAVAARRQAPSCVRARAIRADVKAASSAAIASAEARALFYLLMGRRRVEDAASVAGTHLWRATDKTLSTMLRVAYGESAPPTPTPRELLRMMLIGMARIKTANNIWGLIERFDSLDPAWKAAIAAVFLCPFTAISNYLVPPFLRHPEPCAPEPVCPFLDIQDLGSYNCHPDECLQELVSVTVMTIGGLCISLCVDLCPWLSDTVVPKRCLDSAVAENVAHFSALKKLKKITLMQLVDSMSEEEVRALLHMFKMVDTNRNGAITLAELNDALQRVCSQHHYSQDMINFGEIIHATLPLNDLHNSTLILQRVAFHGPGWQPKGTA